MVQNDTVQSVRKTRGNNTTISGFQSKTTDVDKKTMVNQQSCQYETMIKDKMFCMYRAGFLVYTGHGGPGIRDEYALDNRLYVQNNLSLEYRLYLATLLSYASFRVFIQRLGFQVGRSKYSRYMITKPRIQLDRFLDYCVLNWSCLSRILSGILCSGAQMSENTGATWKTHYIGYKLYTGNGCS